MSGTIAGYSIDFEVRDYELDLQGIVNNAVYLNYLEHARHTFLIRQGIDFAKLHDEGKDLIVRRVEIDYKSSLKSREKFRVTVNTYQDGNLKVIFKQDIFSLPDMKLILEAKTTGVCLTNGKLVRPENIFDMENFYTQSL